MLQKQTSYQLKNGTAIFLIDTFQDYFSSEEYVALKQGDAFFIAKKLEFEANIAKESGSRRRTAQEKIALYRSYFRGRDSMVATSFVDAEGKRGYYPVCLSRKQYPCPRVQKPKFPCRNCKVQNFQPITYQIIYDHLRGYDAKGKTAFYGIYPILPDNTVYFLAIDFDKKDWKTAVSALWKTAEKFGVQPLLEISQSGKGCHVWFFFEEPTPAREARKFGDLLLKQSLVENPEISFDSYDRMLPNQNELAPRGFGNLIALPLQGDRVSKGCSRFIDGEFSLIDDVWDALESTPKISPSQLSQVIRKMSSDFPIEYYTPQNTQVNEELTLFDDEKDVQQASSKEISVTIRNVLVIPRSELSREEIVQLKYLATFSNKAFYEAQRKRLPTNDIPRKICLADVDEQSVYLPRGLESQVLERYPKALMADERADGKPLHIAFNGELLPEQEAALKKLSCEDMGILSAGTGFGKTVLAAKLIADKSVSTLVLVHNKTLAGQW